MKSVFSRAVRKLRFRLLDGPRGAGQPVPEASLDREYSAGNWDHFFGADELPRNAVLAGLIRERCPVDARVLDVGCGSGRLAALCGLSHAGQWLGVDLSQEGLTRARGLGLSRAEFHHGDFETWVPPAGPRFDAIVFNETIGYARSPAAVLQRFARFLSAGGIIAVSLYRSGNSAAQWRAMETVSTTVFACTVTVGRRIWDVRVLTPKSGTIR